MIFNRDCDLKIKSKVFRRARIFFADRVLKTNFVPGAYYDVREETKFGFRFLGVKKTGRLNSYIKSKVFRRARIFFADRVLKASFVPGAYYEVREETKFGFRFR